jgi:hypothetical protein
VPHDPRDPGREPPAELLRLAAEGARNIQRADARQLARADQHLRVALGAHFGSPRRWVFMVFAAIGVGLTVATSSGLLDISMVPVGVVALMGGVLPLAFKSPAIGDAGLERERAWLASRPFPLAGYFEALRQPPTSGALLLVRVRFAGEVPPVDLVQGLLGRIDPQGAVQSAGGRELLLQSGLISGATGIRINKVPVYRNHRIVGYVHRLADELLAPVHASYPLAEVELTRPV